MSIVPILFGSKTTTDRTSGPFSLDPWDPFSSLVSISSAGVKLQNVQIDWKETPTSHVFKADLPGLGKDEVKVEVEEQRFLKIQGERAKEAEEKDHKWHRVRRSFGKFLSSIPLPEDATVEDAKAVLENGVLTVTVPRDKDKKAPARVIQIEGTPRPPPSAPGPVPRFPPQRAQPPGLPCGHPSAPLPRAAPARATPGRLPGVLQCARTGPGSPPHAPEPAPGGAQQRPHVGPAPGEPLRALRASARPTIPRTGSRGLQHAPRPASQQPQAPKPAPQPSSPGTSPEEAIKEGGEVDKDRQGGQKGGSQEKARGGSEAWSPSKRREGEG